MQTKEELIRFLESKFQDLLEEITVDTKPLWGTMDAQRMIEHLALGVKIANGQLLIPAEKIDPRSAKLKTISLLSDKPFPRSFQNPVIQAGLRPYEHESLTVAKQKLKAEIVLFHQYFHSHKSDATCIHNLFGELNYHEWLWFQYKHITHHFMQFGIIPLSDRIH